MSKPIVVIWLKGVNLIQENTRSAPAASSAYPYFNTSSSPTGYYDETSPCKLLKTLCPSVVIEKEVDFC